MDHLEALALKAAPGNEALRTFVAGGVGAGSHVAVLLRPGVTNEISVVFLDSPTLGTGHVVVPGSFNPMHEGHERIAEVAMDLRRKEGECNGCGIFFEMCINNADKGTLPFDEVLRRAVAVAHRGHKLIITKASLFVDKTFLLPKSDFVVGYDTYARIVNPKYYVPEGKVFDDASEEEKRSWVIDALSQFQSTGIRLIVAGRSTDDGEFLTLETAPLFDLPEDLMGLMIPLEGFRLDVSSTALRRQAAAADGLVKGTS